MMGAMACRPMPLGAEEGGSASSGSSLELAGSGFGRSGCESASCARLEARDFESLAADEGREALSFGCGGLSAPMAAVGLGGAASEAALSGADAQHIDEKPGSEVEFEPGRAFARDGGSGSGECSESIMSAPSERGISFGAKSRPKVSCFPAQLDAGAADEALGGLEAESKPNWSFEGAGSTSCGMITPAEASVPCEPGAQLIAFGAKPSGGTAPEPTVRIAGSESKMLADDADCAEDGADASGASALGIGAVASAAGAFASAAIASALSAASGALVHSGASGTGDADAVRGSRRAPRPRPRPSASSRWRGLPPSRAPPRPRA
mmetsp:Transcript_39676/g.83223  ORF Transcript_39676/g.83223 Transcript_39676/m.83223 type:complete len:323 (+) Transcript_39676:176-1144(+)